MWRLPLEPASNSLREDLASLKGDGLSFREAVILTATQKGGPLKEVFVPPLPVFIRVTHPGCQTDRIWNEKGLLRDPQHHQKS